MNFFETLKEKRGPFPTWVWAVLFTGLLAVYLIHKRNAAGGSAATTNAANQANSNLGSAAELANMFQVAGLMPYQGGNVYVNEAQDADMTKKFNPKQIIKFAEPKDEKETAAQWQYIEHLAWIKKNWGTANGQQHTEYTVATTSNPELIKDINDIISGKPDPGKTTNKKPKPKPKPRQSQGGEKED